MNYTINKRAMTKLLCATVFLAGCQSERKTFSMKSIIEIVEFKAKTNVQIEQMIASAIKSNSFVKLQKGFIKRNLSLSDDGIWIDCVEWASNDDAQAAAKAFMNAEDCFDFMGLIDMGTLKMRHLETQMTTY